MTGWRGACVCVCDQVRKRKGSRRRGMCAVCAWQHRRAVGSSAATLVAQLAGPRPTDGLRPRLEFGWGFGSMFCAKADVRTAHAHFRSRSGARQTVEMWHMERKNGVTASRIL